VCRHIPRLCIASRGKNLGNNEEKLKKIVGTFENRAPAQAQAALNNKIWRKTIFNMADGIITPYNVVCGSGIMTLNSPGGSTSQCGRWRWDDMPWNSPKRPPH